jgi:hypothetical protein
MITMATMAMMMIIMMITLKEPVSCNAWDNHCLIVIVYCLEEQHLESRTNTREIMKMSISIFLCKILL